MTTQERLSAAAMKARRAGNVCRDNEAARAFARLAQEITASSLTCEAKVSAGM